MKHTHPATSADPNAMCHGMHSGHTEKTKADSNERVISNYDFEDISADQRTSGMYSVSEWPTSDNGIPSTTCGHCMDNDMKTGITNVSKYNIDNTCNCFPSISITPTCPNTNTEKEHPPCQRSLLEQAMEYLYSLVFNHRSHCERCNPKLVCPRCKALHSDDQPPCPKDPSPCPDDKPQNNKSSWLSSKFKKSSPCPSTTPPCPSTTPPCPPATPACPNVTPKCPNSKPTCPNITPKSPNATPECPNAKRTCPNIIPKCPNATPTCPNAKRPCTNIKPKCPNAPPKCPNAKQTCTNIKPKCPNAPPKCPNATPSCPNAEQPSQDDGESCCIDPPCSATKPPCRKCPAAKSNNGGLNPNDSYSCKESLFELAKTYLQNIIYSHQNACPHCTQQLACCYAKELLTYLREIIEQAWVYTRKYYEQLCQQELEPSLPCSCDAKNGNGNNPPCPPPPNPPVRCPVCFPEPEEDDERDNKRFTPCCLHNSEGVQPHHTSESHNKSCCLSRNFQSLTEPYDADIEPEISECSLDREPSENLHDRDVMGLLSSNNGGPCKTCCKNCADEFENDCDNENGNGKRKLGLSLIMEPNDHRFCTNPTECKHSKESLNQCCVDESPPAQPTCGRRKQPSCPNNERSEQATSNLSCSGGCKKCNTPNAISKKCNKYMADDEYKRFLDDQLRKIENRLKDPGKLCRSNCNCLTCVTGNNCRTGTNQPEERDEETYYYF